MCTLDPVSLKNLRPTEMPLTRWDKLGSNCRIQESEKKKTWGKNVVERGHKHQRRKIRSWLWSRPRNTSAYGPDLSNWENSEVIRSFLSWWDMSKCETFSWIWTNSESTHQRKTGRAIWEGRASCNKLEQILQSHWDISEDERNCGWRVGVVCHSKYTEEGALRRFERQNTKRQY